MIKSKNTVENNIFNKSGHGNLVRIKKSIVVNPGGEGFVDPKIIKKKFFHALSNSTLPETIRKLGEATIGITSPGKGEGKTLVAANLAVSLALAHKKKTLLVDMGVNNPGIHKIFGTRENPGLMESLRGNSLYISQTRIERLYIMPTGKNLNFAMGLGSIDPLRKILKILRKEFPVLILDMPPVHPVENFPAICANESDGLVVVIDTNKTKFEAVDRIFKHIRKKKTLGFILNKTEE